MTNTAQHIIDKCGGPRATAELAEVDVSRVHRWTYPKERGGTGGIIPAKRQALILRKAREQGIDLTPNDFFSTHTQGDAA